MNQQSFLGKLFGQLFGRNGHQVPPPMPEGISAALLSDQKLITLQRQLDYTIRDRRYFDQALLHRSYLQMIESRTHHSNERMEFLGDSIVNLLIAHYLFDKFGDIQEGTLTKYRSRLVNRKALSMCAWKLKLNEFILLNPSATQSLGQGNDSLLADCFEAILAAMFLDSGGSLLPAQNLVKRVLLTQDMFDKFLMIDENYKSTLLEYAQAHRMMTPRYYVVKEEGPDHDKMFTIEVFVGSDAKGMGHGRSKKEAEQQAAMHAVERMLTEERDNPPQVEQEL